VTEGGIDTAQPHDSRVAHPALPADVDCQRGVVDRDDLMASPLQLERDAAGTGPDVEDATSDATERLTFRGMPAPELAEVPGDLLGFDVAVVPLDDDPFVSSCELIEQGASERVLLLAEH
jgi:hypothetical protein